MLRSQGTGLDNCLVAHNLGAEARVKVVEDVALIRVAQLQQENLGHDLGSSMNYL